MEEAKTVLRAILVDPVESNKPDIARNALLATWRLEGQEATEPITEVLVRTQNLEIFGTAIFSLGQIKTEQSMVRIVQQMDRFPDSGSADAVLVDMEEIILNVLSDPDNENLEHAIHATTHLWREGQRERYFPKLKALLATAPVPLRIASLERMIDVTSRLEFEAEKLELRSVLPLIINQPELGEYAEYIQRRLSATLIVPFPQDQSVLVPHD
jgi:hypothetical protein